MTVLVTNLSERITLALKTEALDDQGEVQCTSQESRDVWAHVQSMSPFYEASFHRRPGEMSRTPVAHVARERYQVTLRTQPIKGTIGSVKWKDKTLSPLTAPQTFGERGYVRFQAVVVTHQPPQL